MATSSPPLQGRKEFNIRPDSFQVPTFAPLLHLPADEVLSLVAGLESKGTSPFFSQSGNLPVSLGNLITPPDGPLTLFRCAYPALFFEKSVLSAGGFSAGRSLLECDSGNNNLGYFPLLERFFGNNSESTNYHISNYSGGRGDFFGMHQIAAIHEAERLRYAPNLAPITLDNVCATFGGQGAFRLTASFLRKELNMQSFVVADSTYCNVYAPFLAEGLNVMFAQSSKDRTLPSCSEITKLLDRPGCGGMQYVRFHNPSGESYTTQELESLVLALRNRGQFLVYGETYEEMSFEDQDSSYLEILRIANKLNFSNLIRIKTIAKDRGLAGFRAGYLIGPKDLINFGIQFNSLLAFNPPMTNTRLLVANAYLSAHHHSNVKLQHVEDYLELSESEIEEISANFNDNIHAQREALRSNLRLLIESFFPTFEIESHQAGLDTIENDYFRLFIPKGGINALIELKFLKGKDEIDFVRKSFLMTGLILHTGSFLSHRRGSHIRITLSQASETLTETIRALQYVIGSLDALQLLPAGSLKISEKS